METSNTSFTVADYCAAMERGEIVANKEYQRSEEVWPPAARSFLIETILLGFPMPKVSLYQKTDIKSKKTVKEIVDGQQRSRAIYDFYNNKFQIAKRSDVEGAAGKSYEGLPEALKGNFLSYQITADLFLSATPSEIREVFRRINSYTVPLNPEEGRHARYQGLFKWFVYETAKKYEQWFVDWGVLSDKQIVRMGDAKLITEIAHALLNGVKTTKAKDLDTLYRDNDKEFPHRDLLVAEFEAAMNFLLEFTEIQNGPLMRPHIFYALFLAACQVASPAAAITPVFDAPADLVIDPQIAVANLSSLANALVVEEPPAKFIEFVAACTSKTNVDVQRMQRVKWLGRALLPELL